MAVLLLALFKHPEYIAAVICLIVGLHLLPLASLFQVRVYALVGIALSLLGAGTLLAMLFGLLLGGLWTWPVVVGLGSAHPNLKTVETSPRPASHIPFLSIGLKTSPTLSGQPKPGKMLIRRNLVK